MGILGHSRRKIKRHDDEDEKRAIMYRTNLLSGVGK